MRIVHPEADIEALDRAYTEEKFHRMMSLTDTLFEHLHEAGSPLEAVARELGAIIFELGHHLDHTAGFSIRAPGVDPQPGPLGAQP